MITLPSLIEKYKKSRADQLDYMSLIPIAEGERRRIVHGGVLDHDVFIYELKQALKNRSRHLNLASKMLELARLEFATYVTHGDFDVDDAVYDGWSIEERREFVKEYHKYNGSVQEYDKHNLYLHDYEIMGFLAEKLKT